MIDVDGMVEGEEHIRCPPNGGSARARFVWDLAYRRGARTSTGLQGRAVPGSMVSRLKLSRRIDILSRG